MAEAEAGERRAKVSGANEGNRACVKQDGAVLDCCVGHKFEL